MEEYCLRNQQEQCGVKCGGMQPSASSLNHLLDNLIIFPSRHLTAHALPQSSISAIFYLDPALFGRSIYHWHAHTHGHR